MPLYEIVLESGDVEEVRLTDLRPAVGEVMELHGTRWEIVETLPSDGTATRFRAQPAED